MLAEYLRRMTRRIWLWLGSAAFTILGIIASALWGGPIPWPAYFTVFVIGALIAGYQAFVEVTKEREELRERLTAIEERIPRIKVGLEQDTKVVSSVVFHVTALTEPNYDEEIEIMRKRLLAKYHQQSQQKGTNAVLASIMGIVSNTDYIKEVDIYIGKYRDYLQQQFEYRLNSQRLVQIHVVAENSGLETADDVTLELRLPPQLTVPSAEQLLPMELGEPEPPEEPKTQRSVLDVVGAFGNRFVIPRIVPRRTPTNPDVQGPSLDTKNQQVIVYKVLRLVPKLTERGFDPVSLWLCDIKEDTMPIRITIYASNLPKPLEQIVTVDVRVGKQV